MYLLEAYHPPDTQIIFWDIGKINQWNKYLINIIFYINQMLDR